MLVRGLHQDGVQHPSLRVRHSIAKTSTASFVLRGRLDAIPIPAYGDSVEIRDVSGETVFSGFVRSADPGVSDFGAFLDSATVRCQGHNDALRYRRIHGAEGVEIVEADHGADQFSQVVALLAGYTGATDLDANAVAIRTDVRYQTAGAVLRALAVANDAILHVTTGRQVRLFQRANLTASALGRLGSADLFRYNLLRDPRKTRSRQILRYGGALAQRTINGDGATRDFLVAGTQTAVDYMAASTVARALNASDGDQGLRMRADATAAARTGGGIDFFGGNAGAPGSGLYVGATLAGAAGISLAMLTNGRLQLRAGVGMDAAARYGIALRHDGAGTPLWTSAGISPTIETEGAAPTRDLGADFMHPDEEGQFAVRGETVIGLDFAGSGNVLNQNLVGYRVSGTATVRDGRFDLALPTYDHRTEEAVEHLLVLGDRLHGVWIENNRIKSFAVRFNAGSLTRSAADDWDFAAPANGGRISAFPNAEQSKVWIQVRSSGTHLVRANFARTCYGFTVANGALTRSSSDDFDFTGPSDFGSSSNVGWFANGFLYVGNSGMRRMTFPGGVFDSTDIDFGLTGTNRRMVGFNGRVYLGIGSAGEIDFRAVRVERELLQWDAPAADYNTLNTRRQADSGFRVAVMDPDIIGVSVVGAEFSPIPVDVRSVTQITLNGTREDLGDGQEWRFDVARQKLIQDPNATALTAADALVVDYAARAIAQACNPAAAVMRDDFADLRDSEGLASDDALATAEAFLDRYGTLTDRLSIEIRDHAELAAEAETVQFDTAMLRALGLTDAADADRWLIYDVQLRYNGDIRIQRAECQRGEFRERAVDWWREREGDA